MMFHVLTIYSNVNEGNWWVPVFSPTIYYSATSLSCSVILTLWPMCILILAIYVSVEYFYFYVFSNFNFIISFLNYFLVFFLVFLFLSSSFCTQFLPFLSSVFIVPACYSCFSASCTLLVKHSGDCMWFNWKCSSVSKCVYFVCSSVCVCWCTYSECVYMVVRMDMCLNLWKCV